MYHSSGKLLLTGEYAVLHGALALAVPLKFGQSLIVDTINENKIVWESYEIERLWFSAEFDLQTFSVIRSTDKGTSDFVIKLLKAIKNFKPGIFGQGYILKHKLDFDRNWGLGSSSTLISNLAQWAGIDPFELHFSVSNGSGYDIACATSKKPILYQLIDKKPIVENIEYKPPFYDKLYFAYLGKKMPTAQNVHSFFQNKTLKQEVIGKISALTKEFYRCNKFEDIGILIFELEQLTSRLLNTKPVKNTLFSDYQGAVKSLGAWGGDFAMLVYNGNKDNLKNYLESKNISTFFRFDEIILS